MDVKHPRAVLNVKKLLPARVGMRFGSGGQERTKLVYNCGGIIPKVINCDVAAKLEGHIDSFFECGPHLFADTHHMGKKFL